jgi:hypothetical protein
MQKWASTFAWVVLGVIVVLSVGLYTRYCLAPVPKLPDISTLKAEDATRILSQYKELRELNERELSEHFDLMIAKSLLPVLATLVGYMLGRKK